MKISKYVEFLGITGATIISVAIQCDVRACCHDSSSVARSYPIALMEPERAESYLNKGIADFERGRYPTAIGNFYQALKINPKSALAFYYLGAIYTERYQNAISIDNSSLLMQCSIHRTNELQVFCRRLILHEWQQQQQSLAIKNFTKAIELQPQYPEAYRARGIAQLPNTGAAVSDWQQAISIWQQDLERDRTSARASGQTRDLTEFSLQVDRILKISRNIDLLKDEISSQKNPGSASGYSSLDKSLRKKVRDLYIEANRLLKQGNIQAAKNKYQEAKLILLHQERSQEYREVEQTIAQLDRLLPTIK
jgi:tetratricopeptide (TPR) repeat protein